MKKNIIVSDDNPVMLKILERSVEKSGHNPVCFTSGKKTVDWGKNNSFDLAILDYNMPDYDGMKITKDFKADSSKSNIPIFIVTGHKESSLKDELIKYGANDIILKPFSPNILIKKIKEMIN